MSAVRPFRNPVEVRFGDGAVEGLGDLAGGRRSVIITTPGMERRGSRSAIERHLRGAAAERYADVAPNPTIGSCTRAFEAVRGSEPDLLIALGGGSVIDTAKAVAAQIGSRSDAGWLSSHLRGSAPVPDAFDPPAIIAIPTTAGTGSEVTMWGTIWDEETRGKHSISHPRLYPQAALLEPALTHSVPRATTVASALDALSHAMEAIWNRSANPVSTAVAERAIGLIPDALRRVLAVPDDAAARHDLLEASLLAGLAISNTRTALAHSISYPLTGELGVPHGIASSLTLPVILEQVGRESSATAAPIVRALGARSASDAVGGLRQLFAAAEVGAILVEHVPSAAALDQLRGGLIAPGRAENFVLPIGQDAAAEILRRAYASACA